MSEPIRTCVGCRRRAPRSELVRIARHPEGSVAVDSTGRAPGRGAYVCSSGQKGCLELAAARGRLGRALRVPVSAAEIERLKKEFVS